VASAGFGVMQRLVQVGCTLILVPALLHTLGIAEFGVWGAAASLAWLVSLSDFGAGTALVSLVAREMALERAAEARRQIAAALTMSGALAIFFLLLIWAAFGWHGWGPNGAVYLIAFAALAINLPLNSANNIWMALQKGYISSGWELVQTVVTTVALLAATLYTRDVRIYVALVYGGLVVSNLGSLIHLFFHHPELCPERLPAHWPEMRELVGSGMLFFLMGVVGGFSFMFDTVLALELLGSKSSAQMTIAMRICMTGIGMVTVIAQPLWPAFTDAVHTADRQWVMHKLAWGTALLTVAAGVGGSILVIWGEPLLRLWLHTDLGIGMDLLAAISAWILTQAIIRVPHLLLNGLLVVRYQAVILTIALAVAFTLKFELAGSLGAAGILWGTTISVLFIAVPAFVWRIWRWARLGKMERSIV
jgi:O-antigen/teichoic acid export membrane protein